jgi:WD40 repeat protein
MRHEKSVITVAFDPRGESVLSASFDGTARLWNARTAKPWVNRCVIKARCDPRTTAQTGRRIVTGFGGRYCVRVGLEARAR